MTNRIAHASLAVAAVSLAAALTPAADAAGGTTTSFGGVSTTGALFPNTSGTGTHTCTASVVASATRNTIITAGHCLTGSGTYLSFAPGYVGGAKPYGTWHVTHAYVDPRWNYGHNPQYDVAVLTVAKQNIGGRLQNIQDVTGANVLHASPASGSLVTVPGYNAGSGDRPIRCTTTAYYTSGYPGFNCPDYNDGVSGSPFVQTYGGTNYVSGVIGGLHQGGCLPTTSYSAPFGSAEYGLINRATAGAAGDIVSWAGSDGC